MLRRCSYRKEAPEKAHYEKFRHRLQQRQKWIKRSIPERTGQRHKDLEQLRLADERTRSLKKQREKACTESLAKYRRADLP